MQNSYFILHNMVKYIQGYISKYLIEEGIYEKRLQNTK